MNLLETSLSLNHFYCGAGDIISIDKNNLILSARICGVLRQCKAEHTGINPHILNELIT